MKKLLHHFLHIYHLIKNHVFFPESLNYSLDIGWEILQKKDRWYVGENVITKQKNSFSDIEIKYKKYKNGKSSFLKI